MPHYDYRCKKCQHTFEVFQSMKDSPLEKCPQCGGRVERLIGMGGGIIFKGSGFYATDYKKPKGKEPKEAKPSDACKKCDDNTCSFKKDHSRPN